jgi:hypothetical protein
MEAVGTLTQGSGLVGKNRDRARLREEVRPVKSEIAIYDFRNFDLCKVRKFMVQNAPKSNILSKIALYYSYQKLIYILILINNSFNNLRALNRLKI